MKYLLWISLFSCLATAGWCQASGRKSPPDLTSMSLEQLMNIQVTSVSKEAEPVSQAAAAITVITAEDIRRSGATTIPELLRRVPGLDVAQINSSQWAVSARGFNSFFANKLLVLIDGRSVYTPSSPAFSGMCRIRCWRTSTALRSSAGPELRCGGRTQSMA